MTITVEIDPQHNIRAVNLLEQAVADLGLTMQEAPLVLQGHTFHYYQLADSSEAQDVINALLKIEGVSAAYIQQGTPPAL